VTQLEARQEAPTENPTPGGEVNNGVPEAVVVSGGDGQIIAKKKTGGSGGTWRCRYFANVAGEGAPSLGEPITPEVGQFVALICFDATGLLVHTEALYFDPANPLGNLAAGYRAAEAAREQVHPIEPDIHLSPPAAAFQLVGVPSWFWIGEAWVPASASATIGAVTSTVTATPTAVDWQTGDCTTLSCDRPGTPFDPRRPVVSQHSDCTHIYTRSSRHQPGGVYQVTATIHYVVTWEASTGEGGALEPITREASLAVRVQEAQALID
jgi:hypothetical protein